jgi:cysteine-rich repeat protein
MADASDAESDFTTVTIDKVGATYQITFSSPNVSPQVWGATASDASGFTNAVPSWTGSTLIPTTSSNIAITHNLFAQLKMHGQNAASTAYKLGFPFDYHLRLHDEYGNCVLSSVDDGAVVVAELENDPSDGAVAFVFGGGDQAPLRGTNAESLAEGMSVLASTEPKSWAVSGHVYIRVHISCTFQRLQTRCTAAGGFGDGYRLRFITDGKWKTSGTLVSGSTGSDDPTDDASETEGMLTSEGKFASGASYTNIGGPHQTVLGSATVTISEGPLATKVSRGDTANVDSGGELVSNLFNVRKGPPSLLSVVNQPSGTGTDALGAAVSGPDVGAMSVAILDKYGTIHAAHDYADDEVTVTLLAATQTTGFPPTDVIQNLIHISGNNGEGTAASLEPPGSANAFASPANSLTNTAVSGVATFPNGEVKIATASSGVYLKFRHKCIHKWNSQEILLVSPRTDCVHSSATALSCTPGSGFAITQVCGDKLISGIETCDDGYGDQVSLLYDAHTTATLPSGTNFKAQSTSVTQIGRPAIITDGCSATCQLETVSNDGNTIEYTHCVDPHRKRSSVGDNDGNDALVFPLQTADSDNHGYWGLEFTFCGDGLRACYEECDDGNSLDDDGCSKDCTIETGWVCPVKSYRPSSAKATDFPLSPVRGAVDGNGAAAQSDGVAVTVSTRKFPQGNTPHKSLCHPICGDGIVRGEEPCDDDNTADGDGCSSICEVEDGWQCCRVASGSSYVQATPTTWSTTLCTKCGDGKKLCSEECDDGNINDGDGCKCVHGTRVYSEMAGSALGAGVSAIATTDDCDAADGSCACDTINNPGGCTVDRVDARCNNSFSHGPREALGVVINYACYKGTGVVEFGMECTGGGASSTDLCKATCQDGRSLWQEGWADA